MDPYQTGEEWLHNHVRDLVDYIFSITGRITVSSGKNGHTTKKWVSDPSHNCVVVSNLLYYFFEYVDDFIA